MSRCEKECKSPTRSQAHCKTCHKTFSSVSGFDRHRRGGECVIPEGMHLANGLWRMPADEGWARRREALRGTQNLNDE